MLIGQQGQTVTRVERAAAGIEALQTGTFDLVLVDLGLPDLPSSTVLAAARAAASRPCVCVVSGSAQGAMELDLPGADLYVEKVQVPERLDDIVRAARERRSR
jgi:DNA-binding response OmpR family regulator